MSKPTRGRLSEAMLNQGCDLLAEFKPVLFQLFDLSGDAVIVVDKYDAVVYVNHQFLRLSGLTSDVLLGHVFAKLCEEYVAIRAYIKLTQKVISIKKTTFIERVIDPIKSQYEFVTISPVTCKAHSTIGAILVAKRVQIGETVSEQSLREKWAYQQTLMDSMPFMVWLKDKENNLLATNQAYANAVGVSDSQYLIGKSVFDFWPHHLAKGYMEDDVKVLESGEVFSLSEKIVSKSGDAHWADTYKAPVIVNGHVIGTVGYARDLSEQQKLLSAINEKDFQFVSLLQNLPLYIVRYDIHCKRTFINNKSNTIYQAEELLGKTPLEGWSDDVKNITAAQFQAKLMDVLSRGESENFELHCEVDGEIIVNMTTLHPEFDENHQVVGVVAIANDVTEISQYRHDLEFMAYHDGLTKLPNRAFLNQQMQMLAKKDDRFGLMFMDLDFFKEINDTLGHVVGDRLLIDVTKRLTASVRSKEVIARIGGDEFAILIPELKDGNDLNGLATRIAKQLTRPFQIEGINFFVTASIGGACYPSDSNEVEDLIKFADTAMYEAKKQGRNNFQIYNTSMTEQAMEHLAIATALRYAIPKDELFLLYQPKVDIRTGEVLGAEALLRWHGKVLGQIQPDKFIPIAEESGLIVDIGHWVLQKACVFAKQLNQPGHAPCNIAVNVSSKEFFGRKYIETLQHTLLTTDCRPEWLTLELTESLLLEDTGHALQALTTIDEMGIQLSIDDFGTGYSALAYLSKFPIRQVKIDRSFVRDICDSESAATLIKAIIAMTKSLGKDLVAEGIETNAQAMLLNSFGCQQAQGFLYSKPVTAAELVHMIAQQQNH